MRAFNYLAVVISSLTVFACGACGGERHTAAADTSNPQRERPAESPPMPPPPPPAPPVAEPSTAPDAGAPHAPPADDSPCGARGQPPCPLQGYMKTTMMPSMRSGGEALTSALTRVAGWAPDGSWNEGERSWRAIAERGAEAARSGNRPAIQASCKACHVAWQKRYRAEFRRLALPAPDSSE